jgi:hypothetical protein
MHTECKKTIRNRLLGLFIVFACWAAKRFVDKQLFALTSLRALATHTAGKIKRLPKLTVGFAAT